MSGSPCCSDSTVDCPKQKQQQLSGLTNESGFLKRCLYFFRWMFTGSVIILLPKCPICLAGYIAMATGIGFSLSVASFIRVLMIILCIISLATFAARRIYIYYNKEQLYLSHANHLYKINFLALKLSLISVLYYLIVVA